MYLIRVNEGMRERKFQIELGMFEWKEGKIRFQINMIEGQVLLSSHGYKNIEFFFGTTTLEVHEEKLYTLENINVVQRCYFSSLLAYD